MNEKIKMIRENLKDPKKKALTQLAIYAVFFAFVFIFIGVSESSSNSNYTDYVKEEKKDKISNYEYVYNINNNGIINQIVGTLKEDEESFNYNNLNYIKKEDIIYLNNTPVTLDFDVDRYKYEQIKLLIKNSDSKTTYTDSEKIVYNMNVIEYFTLLNELSNCGIVDCTYVNISMTVESDEYINHVLIDLSNYYGYKYIIEINYNNINKISTN